jgi:hypothetical protein
VQSGQMLETLFVRLCHVGFDASCQLFEAGPTGSSLLEDLPEARIDSCVLVDELANLRSRRLLFGPPIDRTGNAKVGKGARLELLASQE